MKRQSTEWERVLASHLQNFSQGVNIQNTQRTHIIQEQNKTEKKKKLRLSDVKNWLLRKDPDAGKDWWKEEKRVTENEMVGWHHWLNGHEFEQAPTQAGEGQGGLACNSPWGLKESDTTERLNWTVYTLDTSIVSRIRYFSGICIKLNFHMLKAVTY